MKKITTLLTAIIGMALMNQVSATHVTVEVPTAGQLNSLIQDANCDSITISGNLNGNDFRFIQNNMPNLIYLNIAKVIIPDNKIPSSGLQSKTTLQQIFLPDSCRRDKNDSKRGFLWGITPSEQMTMKIRLSERRRRLPEWRQPVKPL